MERFPKFCAPVKIQFSDGTQEYGGIYVRQNQRVIDVFCDDRSFMPFRTMRSTILLNKALILHVELVDLEEVEAKKDLFPPLDIEYLKRNSW